MGELVKATIRAEGPRVLVAVGGRKFLDLTWDAADELARAIIAKAREAEAHAKAEQLVADSGLLLRAGTGLLLSNDPRIVDAAKIHAAHDRTLRRAIPSIRSHEVFGLPSIRRGPAPPKAAEG